MNNSKLNGLLENIFKNRRDVWDKHIGYFYEKENFMADTILKLSRIKLNKAYLAVLSFGRLFLWLDLPYCRN